MELNSLRPQSAEMVVHLADGSLSDVVLSVISTDSKEYHAVARRYFDDMLSPNRKRGAEQHAQAAAELIASCIVGWKGLTENGEPIRYSNDKAVELMATPELLFIREQVEAYVKERTNFFLGGDKAASSVDQA
jgi:hypothetical protein